MDILINPKPIIVSLGCDANNFGPSLKALADRKLAAQDNR